MKNTIIFLGSLCLILALGLVFTGCKDEGIQGVELDSISSPNNVTAAWAAAITTDDPTTVEDERKAVRLLVTWDAVKDADGYNIVYSQEGKKNYLILDSNAYDGINVTATTKSTTADNDGYFTYTVTHTADIDKAQWERNQSQLVQNYGGLKLRIGVVSKPKNTDHRNPSDPAWAKDLIDIPSTYKQAW